jgi:hypothetical protein
MAVASVVCEFRMENRVSHSNCGVGFFELCKTSLDQEIGESPLDMVRPPDLVTGEVKALISKRWYHRYPDAQKA